MFKYEKCYEACLTGSNRRATEGLADRENEKPQYILIMPEAFYGNVLYWCRHADNLTGSHFFLLKPLI